MLGHFDVDGLGNIDLSNMLQEREKLGFVQMQQRTCIGHDLTEVLRVARSIEFVDHRARALGAVALALAQAGYIEQALVVTRIIELADRRAQALRAVASLQAQADRGEEAGRILTESLEVARSTECDSVGAGPGWPYRSGPRSCPLH